MFAPLLLALSLVLPGTWEGELQTSRWPVFMTIRLTGDESKGSISVLGQNLPITELTVTDATAKIVAGSITLDAKIDGDRLVGKDFSFDRLPQYPKPKDRVEAWQQDLEAFTTRFLKYDRSFTAGEKARAVEIIDSIRAGLASMSDDEVIMKIATAVAQTDNAHTRLYLLRNRTELRRLPIRLWWFRDSLRVIRATPEYRSLLGCRVDAIGGVEARHVRDLTAAAYSGNPSWRDYKSVYFMTSPEALHGFGIVADPEAIEFTLADCSAAPRAIVKPLPLVKKRGPTEAWWDLSPMHKDPDREWVHVLDRSKAPLYLRDPQHYYWYEFIPAAGVLYLQYNRAAEMESESMKAFGERLLAQDVKALVIDLRFNTGGDMGIAADLMQKLRSKAVPTFVITGRATFSAGISTAAQWRTAPNVKFVGEHPGDGPRYWSEGGNVVMPNSGLYLHFANAEHDDSFAKSLRPDIPASMTWSEYMHGIDVAMNSICYSLGACSASKPNVF